MGHKMRKVIWAAIVCLSAANAADAADQAIVDKYNKSCKICHATGAAGAPITGNSAQWASRMQKGIDALVVSVDKGMNAMPPKGLCTDCTNEDFKALINYMVEAK